MLTEKQSCDGFPLEPHAAPVPIRSDPRSVLRSIALEGAVLVSAPFGTHLVAGAGGSIINMSSVGSVRPTADVIPHASAKVGLNRHA
jgi:hypothetical protein